MKTPYRVLLTILGLAIPFMALGVALPIAPALSGNQIWTGDNTFNGTVVFDAGVTFGTETANTLKVGVLDAGAVNVTGNQLGLGTLVVDGGVQLNATLGVLGAVTLGSTTSAANTITSTVANGSTGFALTNLGSRIGLGDSSTYLTAGSSFNLQAGDGNNSGFKSGSFTSGQGIYYAASGATAELRGQTADGAGSIQVVLRAQNTVSNATANIVSIQNGSTILSYFDKDGAPQLNVAGATKPTCSSSHRGKIWYTPGASLAADAIEVCAKSTADVYAWRAMATIP